MGFKKIILSIFISAIVAKVSANGIKPGTCPTLTIGPCVKECSSDADCTGVKKCCQNPCGSQCFTPVEQATPKPGKCHEIKPGEVGICAFTCVNDESCGGAKKCCKTACGGTVCEEPVGLPPKNGTCPVIGDTGVCVETCSDDQGCKGADKCCKTACGGTVCIAPLEPKPGQCPVVEPSNGPICESICEDDYGCVGSQKCCKNSCGGTYCVEPLVVTKPGECPAPVYTDPERCPVVKFRECDGDLTCPDDLKCCCTGCNFVCTKPVKPVEHKPPCPVKPGSCPAPWYTPLQCQLIKIPSCQADADCKGELKCCNNGCGFSSCTERFQKKGVCPVTPAQDCVCERVDIWCSSDDCCEGGLKCCDNGCGTSCVKPVDQTPRPGECPVALTLKGSDVTPDCKQIKCRFDSECNAGLKCCSNFCGGTECTFV